MRTILLALLVVSACSPSAQQTDKRPADIIANNAFFYYDDVATAAAFYTGTLGLEVVADYEFAKILRVADTSYLTLVAAESGMHTTDEPKAVAIALITDELEAWYDYLVAKEVPMSGELKVAEGRPHDGFVAYDPEGYYLEFERFNPHAENEQLMPVLDAATSRYTSAGPPELGFKATVLWTYYSDLAGAERFYEEVMGLELMVDQGWAKVYPTSATGFVGLVDGAKGMHQATQDKAITVSFLTTDVDAWLEHMKAAEARERLELRHQEIVEEGFVRAFVAYDPENYFLEFDTFVESEGNEALLSALSE
jgi:catechol 2,3-dioxygenase-like lactoylglutathione lyase family enzyme